MLTVDSLEAFLFEASRRKMSQIEFKILLYIASSGGQFGAGVGASWALVSQTIGVRLPHIYSRAKVLEEDRIIKKGRGKTRINPVVSEWRREIVGEPIISDMFPRQLDYQLTKTLKYQGDCYSCGKKGSLVIDASTGLGGCDSCGLIVEGDPSISPPPLPAKAG